MQLRSRKWFETQSANARRASKVHQDYAKLLEARLAISQTACERALAHGSELASQRESLAAERLRILSVLSDVAVYEGMDVGDNLVAYLSELVRDHEELEARIDASLMALSDKKRPTKAEVEVAHLLRGGPRVDDTIEGAL